MNQTETPTLIDSKDIARRLGCSPRQVRSNEVRLGIKQWRRDINARCVRYLAIKVWAELKARGYLP